MQIVSISPQYADTVDRESFLHSIQELLNTNYSNWYKKKTGIREGSGVGIRRHNDPNAPISLEQYQQDMGALIQNLLRQRSE